MSNNKLNTPILVVDDDAMVREIVVEYLKSYGFTNIIEERNSVDALKLIQDRNEPIDLIVSDWEMPTPSGIDLLRTVRGLKHRAAVKFIMITSQKSMERIKIAQAASLGVDAYIVKPFRSQTLKEKVWEVLGIDEQKSA